MSLTCKHMEWKEYPRVSRQGFDMVGRWTRTAWFEESSGTNTPLGTTSEVRPIQFNRQSTPLGVGPVSYTHLTLPTKA